MFISLYLLKSPEAAEMFISPVKRLPGPLRYLQLSPLATLHPRHLCQVCKVWINPHVFAYLLNDKYEHLWATIEHLWAVKLNDYPVSPSECGIATLALEVGQGLRSRSGL